MTHRTHLTHFPGVSAGGVAVIHRATCPLVGFAGHDGETGEEREVDARLRQPQCEARSRGGRHEDEVAPGSRKVYQERAMHVLRSAMVFTVSPGWRWEAHRTMDEAGADPEAEDRPRLDSALARRGVMDKQNLRRLPLTCAIDPMSALRILSAANLRMRSENGRETARALGS